MDEWNGMEQAHSTLARATSIAKTYSNQTEEIHWCANNDTNNIKIIRE